MRLDSLARQGRRASSPGPSQRKANRSPPRPPQARTRRESSTPTCVPLVQPNDRPASPRRRCAQPGVGPDGEGRPMVASMTSKRDVGTFSRARRAAQHGVSSVPASVLEGRRRPAVSMKQTGPSGVSTTVSMVSRGRPRHVVHDRALLPQQLVEGVDLPTLGPARWMATPLACHGLPSREADPGASLSRPPRPAAAQARDRPRRPAGRRSPGRAAILTGKGSPSAEGDELYQAPASRLVSSTLLTTRRTGGPARRMTLAAARSSR